MARPLRIQLPGLIYHLVSRGNGRMVIFLDDIDRVTFLELLAATASGYSLACIAYCLMDNHYHLVVQTAHANLSQAVQSLNAKYAQWWNRRHNRTGHVLQGRFRAQVVQTEEYLREACRYVVLNPVRATIVTRPAKYQWSSYRATAGLDSRPEFLQDESLLERFGEGDARAAYREFVLSALGNGIGRLPRNACVLGSDDYARRLCYGPAPKEIIRAHREQVRPPLSSLFARVLRREERDVMIREAHAGQGYSQREIAEFLGLHRTTVGKAIVRAESLVPEREKSIKSGSDPL